MDLRISQLRENAFSVNKVNINVYRNTRDVIAYGIGENRSLFSGRSIFHLFLHENSNPKRRLNFAISLKRMRLRACIMLNSKMLHPQRVNSKVEDNTPVPEVEEYFYGRRQPIFIPVLEEFGTSNGFLVPYWFNAP